MQEQLQAEVMQFQQGNIAEIPLTHAEVYQQYAQNPAANPDLLAHMQRLADEEALAAMAVVADVEGREAGLPTHEITPEHHEEHIKLAEPMVPDIAEKPEAEQDMIGELIELGEEALDHAEDTATGETASSNTFGEQMSIEHEPGIGWPVTNKQKGMEPSGPAAEGNYLPPQDATSIEEDVDLRRNIEREKAHKEWTSGQIDYEEFNRRTAKKTPRTYQQSLVRQNGELFREDESFIADPHAGVAAEDGTFWHASNHEMEPGDRLLPAGEVPNAVHEANKADRYFNSSSAPTGSSHANEKDFAMGTPRSSEYLPTSYGKHVYKVSSPNTKIVPTVNGDETWAEGGGRIVQRMSPDFARNYETAKARIRDNSDAFQGGLPGMENGMKFVPEKELNDLTQPEFREKYINNEHQMNVEPSNVSPEDMALPGLEHYGKQPYAPDTSSKTSIM